MEANIIIQEHRAMRALIEAALLIKPDCDPNGDTEHQCDKCVFENYGECGKVFLVELFDRLKNKLLCDRCGKDISIEFYGKGGNCTVCGDDLCAACAGSWSEDGECEKCNSGSGHK